MDALFEVVKSRYGELCEAGYTVAFCLGSQDRFFKCSYKDVTCLEMNNDSVRIMSTDHTNWVSASSLNEIISSLIDIQKQSTAFVESLNPDTLNAAIVDVIKLVLESDFTHLYGHIVKNMLMDKFNVPT